MASSNPIQPPPPGGYHQYTPTGIPAQYYNPNGITNAGPPPHPYRTQDPPVPWSTDLCHCFSDIKNCCITCWCPCITFGQVAEIIDKGSTSCGASGALYALIAFVTGCSCLYSCLYRSKMRQQYSLEETPCPDCLVHCCCEPCGLCQEYRELKNRGFNMEIGWHANLEERNRQLATAPPMPPIVEGGMNRT